VLKRFPPKPPSEPNNKPEPTWREADRLLHAAIDTSSSEAKKLSTLLHYLANKNELLTNENEGLRDALSTKKKHNKKGKALDLQQREEYHGGAVFWSPRKKREAKARDATNKRLAEEDKL
jgi:regulator of replication initiation timing